MIRAPIDIGLPEKIQFFDHRSYIEIVQTWFGWEILILAAFAIFWDGFLFFWYNNLPQEVPLIAVLFPLLHVGVGVCLTYYVLAGWFNRTHIFANNQQIGVRHRPLPWFGNKDIEASDLTQLYAKEKISTSYSMYGSATSTTYEVRAVTKSGRNIKLVGDLATQEQAIFIEQQIKKYLSIEDVSVPGEIYKHRA